MGAFAVHGLVGLGTLAIGLFAKYDDAFLGRDDAGLFYGGGLDQIAVQAVLAVIVAAWTIVTGFIVFGALSVPMGLRVSPEEEQARCFRTGGQPWCSTMLSREQPRLVTGGGDR